MEPETVVLDIDPQHSVHESNAYFKIRALAPAVPNRVRKRFADGALQIASRAAVDAQTFQLHGECFARSRRMPRHPWKTQTQVTGNH